MKQTLLKAKSVAIAKEGASDGTIDKMYEKLGIAQALAAKTRYEDGTEMAGESVMAGRADLDILPLSEIPLVKGVVVAGPLPGDLQNYLKFSGSVTAKKQDPAAAKKAIAFLTSAAVKPVFKSKGMQ